MRRASLSVLRFTEKSLGAHKPPDSLCQFKAAGADHFKSALIIPLLLLNLHVPLDLHYTHTQFIYLSYYYIRFNNNSVTRALFLFMLHEYTETCIN